MASRREGRGDLTRQRGWGMDHRDLPRGKGLRRDLPRDMGLRRDLPRDKGLRREFPRD